MQKHDQGEENYLFKNLYIYIYSIMKRRKMEKSMFCWFFSFFIFCQVCGTVEQQEFSFPMKEIKNFL